MMLSNPPPDADWTPNISSRIRKRFIHVMVSSFFKISKKKYSSSSRVLNLNKAKKSK
jgi:hypothetical protein